MCSRARVGLWCLRSRMYCDMEMKFVLFTALLNLSFLYIYCCGFGFVCLWKLSEITSLKDG